MCVLTYCIWVGNGGSVTINNVQGVGRDQWVALYYANGRYESYSSKMLL